MNILTTLSSPKFLNLVVVSLTQIMGVISIPIIAIYYTPSQFGEFAIIQLFALVLSVIFTLRLELAIPLIKEIDEYSLLLIGISIICISTLFIASLISLSAFFLGFSIDIMKWSIPLAVGLSILNITIFTLTWRSQYILSVSLQFILSFLVLSLQLILGVSTEGTHENGLEIGALIGYTITAAICIFIIKSHFHFKPTNCKIIFNTIKSNRNIFFYNSLSSILFSISSNWPLLILSSLFGLTEAGFFSMAKKIIDTGTRLIDGSYRNIIYGEYSKKRDYVKFKALADKNIKTILILSLATGLIIFLFGNQLFIYILGEKWEGLYIYLLCLLPMFFAINGTIVHKVVLTVEKQNKIMFLIDLMLFFTRPLVIIISLFLSLSAPYTIFLFSLTSIFAVFIITKKSSEIFEKIVINHNASIKTKYPEESRENA